METGSRGAPQAPGTVVMAVLHPSVRSPLPRITPLLAAALERRGWVVVTTFWGGRTSDEGWMRKIADRSLELGRALGKLRAHRASLLLVNSAHTRRGVGRDLPLVVGARCMGHGAVVLWHGSGPERIEQQPWSPFAVASRLLCRLADAVLVLSSGELSHWRRIEPAGRFVLVTNPYVTHLTPLRREEGAAPTILFVGRLLRGKGVYELVEAFSAVAAGRRCRLVVVGDGPERPSLAEAVTGAGLSDRVEMPGYLDPEALRRQYESADLFVLPSYSEGFPTVLSEAMDAGLPIVTTRCGGMVDHLIEEENCLFVRPRDPHGLEDALARLLDDAGLRERMGAANRRAVQGFAPDEVVVAYDEVLRAVAARRRGWPA